MSTLSRNCGLSLLSLLKLPDLPSPLPSKAVPIPAFTVLCPLSSASLLITVLWLISLSGVVRSRNLLLLTVGVGKVCVREMFAFKAAELCCRRSGSADCTEGARGSGRGCWEVYSLDAILVRPISVAARDGVRKRASSSSGSSVPARRLRSKTDVLRPAMVDCVGVETSEGV